MAHSKVLTSVLHRQDLSRRSSCSQQALNRRAHLVFGAKANEMKCPIQRRGGRDLSLSSSLFRPLPSRWLSYYQVNPDEPLSRRLAAPTPSCLPGGYDSKRVGARYCLRHLCSAYPRDDPGEALSRPSAAAAKRRAHTMLHIPRGYDSSLSRHCGPYPRGWLCNYQVLSAFPAQNPYEVLSKLPAATMHQARIMTPPVLDDNIVLVVMQVLANDALCSAENKSWIRAGSIPLLMSYFLGVLP
ncbi:uncharacterized protein EV420DRAFT_1643355 [Desarmillaria tabescens]|uniref:Uncharacterized protein n=1 Tax=Armillaria tabescens TaxID=1929756 RepID=A0AA39KBG1_ARMTA|nr:uncharacterized protein EV420DRAFT_1643355 [Desarmillaria tabescens]KAK0458005.1 hypothetical protein EV420DRAFT_1643355 [Desarmillaria tabescens]